MQRVWVISIVIVFVGLVAWGVVKQLRRETMGYTANPMRLRAVPTLAATSNPALLLAPTFTAIPAIPATFTPPAAPLTTTLPIPQSHTVQAGETLFSIAQRYSLTLEMLAAANNITNINLVQTGQTLLIPMPTAATGLTAPTLTPHPLTSSSPTLPPASPPPSPDLLNGIPIASIIIIPENVVQNARAIFAQGQALGRNRYAYSKVGDSTIQNPHFMARFDEPGGYNLGPYAYLQPAVDYFAGSHGREGTAVRKGLHSWTVTDPLWADKTVCQANESPIACEIRLHNPAFILIRLGSNDSGVPDMFDQNVRQVVDLAISSGIIPVIGTKADRFEGSNVNNDVLRQIAADYQIPLWDFDVAAQMIPGRGLDVDNVHLTSYFDHDYSSPVAFQRGHGVHSLTALMMLNVLLKEVISGQ